jgi:hypothetical protein
MQANKITLRLPLVTLPARGAVWDQATVDEFASAVVAADPDVFIFLAFVPWRGDMLNGIALMKRFKALNWLPKAVLFPGGAAQHVSHAMNDAFGIGAGGYFYDATFNAFEMRAPEYDAQAGTPSVPNWEPFPSTPNASMLSPQVMRAEFLRDWGDTSPLSLFDGNVQPLIVTSLLVQATKLFYLAGTDDARVMQQVSASLSGPSCFGALAFDQYGRMAQNEQYVAQRSADGLRLNLITPLDVGQTDVYPIPTWDERIAPQEGSASFLGTRAETAVVVVTALVIAYLLALLVGLLLCRHATVLKSASPGCCALVLLGGGLCVSSNFGVSLYALRRGCAVHAWLLTTGFTLMFSALLLKTFRVYRIFDSSRLQSVRVSDATLYALCGALVAVDVLLNVIWSATSGFPTRYVRVDVDRPAKDYIECGYDSTAHTMIQLHLAYKAALMLASVVFTVLSRNLPSLFNESASLAAANYNAVLLCAFAVPLVATEVAGRQGTYLVRCFALLLLVASTASILMMPKFVALCRRYKRTPKEKKPSQPMIGLSTVTLTHSPDDASPRGAHGRPGAAYTVDTAELESMQQGEQQPQHSPSQGVARVSPNPPGLPWSEDLLDVLPTVASASAPDALWADALSPPPTMVSAAAADESNRPREAFATAGLGVGEGHMHGSHSASGTASVNASSTSSGDERTRASLPSAGASLPVFFPSELDRLRNEVSELRRRLGLLSPHASAAAGCVEESTEGAARAPPTAARRATNGHTSVPVRLHVPSGMPGAIDSATGSAV